MFQTKVVEKIKTHILCSIVFLFKNCGIYKTLEKYCRAGQATVDSMAHTHFMLDTGYTHRDYVMLIAFPLHHWLDECTSVLYVAFVLQ